MFFGLRGGVPSVSHDTCHDFDTTLTTEPSDQVEHVQGLFYLEWNRLLRNIYIRRWGSEW